MIEFLSYVFACIMVGANAWSLGNALNKKQYWLASIFGTFLVLLVYLNKDIPTKFGWW